MFEKKNEHQRDREGKARVAITKINQSDSPIVGPIFFKYWTWCHLELSRTNTLELFPCSYVTYDSERTYFHI